MNYPKMLYKGDPIYTDSAELRDDLASKKVKTIIVEDEEQEGVRRDQGYVDLALLMKGSRPIEKREKEPEVQLSGPMPSMEALTAAYEAKYGKKPHHKMKAESIAKAL